MVHAREDDLVAWRERLRDRPTQLEAERRHVWTHNDFRRAGRVEKVSHAFARPLRHFVIASAGGEDAAGIGVHRRVILGDRLHHAERDLRSSGIVHEYRQ